MQPGDLVRIKRAGIGVPSGTLALCMAWQHLSTGTAWGAKIWRVELIGTTRRLTGRYLENDLETISESR